MRYIPFVVALSLALATHSAVADEINGATKTNAHEVTLSQLPSAFDTIPSEAVSEQTLDEMRATGKISTVVGKITSKLNVFSTAWKVSTWLECGSYSYACPAYNRKN